MKKRGFRGLSAVCLGLFLLQTIGCRQETLPAARNGFALDTAVSVTIYALSGSASPGAVLDGCFE